MTRDDILAAIRKNDKATNAALAAELGTTPSDMATRTKQLFNKGYVTREIVGRTLTGLDVYGYRVHNKVTPTMNKRERLTTVRERRDNGKTSPSAQSDDIASMIQNIGNALAKQIVAQVAINLQPLLQRELAQVIPQQPVEIPQQPVEIPQLDVKALISTQTAPKRERLPTVGIVGLLPQQAGLIATEFGEVFDLRFWNNESNSSLKSMGIACEVVLCTKWCSHSTTETLASVGANWRKVTGGMNELRTTLTALYVEA